MPNRSTRIVPRLVLAGSWLVILLPLLVYLSYLPRFGYLQNNDYYFIIGRVVDEDRGGFTSELGRWLTVKSNEHRATVPALIYAANVVWNHGDNRALSFLALGLMTAVFVLLYCRLPADVRGSPGARTVFGLAVAAFAWTPVAAHNVAMGFSGTQWFLANALAIGAMVLVWGRDPDWRTHLAVLGLGLVGALSYSTHLASWPAIVVGALLLRWGWRHLATLAAIAAAVSALVLVRFEMMSYHPPPRAEPWTLIRYLGVYLGSAFSNNPDNALVLGWGGVAAAVLGLAFLFSQFSRETRRDAVFWLMVMLYATGAALGTAVSRAGMGEDKALASRYASLPGLFWIALVVLAGLAARRSVLPRRRGPRLAVHAALVLVALGMVALHYRRGLRQLDAFVGRTTRQEVATLGLLRGYRDTKLLSACVTQSPWYFWEVHDFLRRVDHVPFDRALPPASPRTIPPELRASEPRPGLAGFFHDVYPLDEGQRGVFRVQGWAHHPDARVAEVVLLDARGQVHGEIVTGIHRGYVALTRGRDALASGWEGYVEVEGPVEPLRAHVRLEDDPLFYPLRWGEKLKAIFEPSPTGS